MAANKNHILSPVRGNCVYNTFDSGLLTFQICTEQKKIISLREIVSTTPEWLKSMCDMNNHPGDGKCCVTLDSEEVYSLSPGSNMKRVHTWCPSVTARDPLVRCGGHLIATMPLREHSAPVYCAHCGEYTVVFAQSMSGQDDAVYDASLHMSQLKVYNALGHSNLTFCVRQPFSLEYRKHRSSTKNDCD